MRGTERFEIRCFDEASRELSRYSVRVADVRDAMQTALEDIVNMEAKYGGWAARTRELEIWQRGNRVGHLAPGAFATAKAQVLGQLRAARRSKTAGQDAPNLVTSLYAIEPDDLSSGSPAWSGDGEEPSL